MTLAPVSVEQTLAPEATEGPVEVIDLSGGNTGDTSIDSTSTGDTSTGDTSTDDSADTGADTGDDAGVAPSPTPLSGSGNGATGENAEYVWSPASGLYYHSNENCPSIEQGVQVWRVTREIAENSRHQSPCPDCIGGGSTTTYYGTLGGKYYHIDEKCSNMKNPLVYTKQAAENEGKQACPVCILKTKDSLDEDENITAVLINKESEDKSGLSVYATKEGTYYHVKKDCSNMKNATKLSLRDALLAGKAACPTCCSSAGTVVYCTAGGKSYHTDKNCQGMTGAKKVTLAEAMVLGKTKCDVCVKGTLGDAAAAEAESASKEKTKTVSLTGNATGDNVKVYATQNGTYYHTNNTCSGMKDAQLYTLKSMLLAGKKACPVCASSANTQVYAVKGGKYYHSYATCSGMKNATSGTLADALAAGFKRCPDCWGTTTTDGRTTTTTGKDGTTTTTTTKNGTTTTTTTNKDGTTTKSTTRDGVTTSTTTGGSSRAAAAASKATASNTYVYATKAGQLLPPEQQLRRHDRGQPHHAEDRHQGRQEALPDLCRGGQAHGVFHQERRPLPRGQRLRGIGHEERHEAYPGPGADAGPDGLPPLPEQQAGGGIGLRGGQDLQRADEKGGRGGPGCGGEGREDEDHGGQGGSGEGRGGEGCGTGCSGEGHPIRNL